MAILEPGRQEQSNLHVDGCLDAVVAEIDNAVVVGTLPPLESGPARPQARGTPILEGGEDVNW